MPSTPYRRFRPYRPHLEPLEAREVPTVLTVTNLLDHAAGSLRAEVLLAQDGDTIQFADGLRGQITLTTGEIAVNHSIRIEGPGAEAIRISGNHASRVFNIARNLTVAISGLTIVDGLAYSPGGGGIYNAGTLTVIGTTLSGNGGIYGGGIANIGTLTVTGSTLSGNSANLGGGIEISAGIMTITDSTLNGNSASGSLGFGGGINNDNSTVFITGSVLSGNVAYSAGGIFSSGALTVTNSTLSGNAATFAGGIDNTGMLTILRSTLSDNSALNGSGGGIYSESFASIATVTIADSTLSGNSASNGSGGGFINYSTGPVTITDAILSGNSASHGSGGGIVNSDGGTMTVTDSILSSNSANGTFSVGGGIDNLGTLTVTRSTLNGNSANDAAGGGIDNLGTLTITDATFSSNTAGVGGGIDNFGTLTITSSTFSGNAAAGGGGVLQDPLLGGATTVRNTILAGNSAPSSPDVSGLLVSRGHNLIGDGTGGSGFLDTDVVGTHANPIDPLLGSLQDNGGPTPTMALLVGSPAIDAGDNTDAPPTDQRGAPRIINGTIDIGAYEVQAAPSPSCSVAQALLWPPNHQLINVGFSVQLNEDADPSTRISVQVYANDNAAASDAADIGPDTLQLRSERQGHGQGRVYLIVATATDASGQTGFDVCTGVIPHDQSARSIAQVQAAAASATAYYQDFQTAPADYALLDEGSAATGDNGSPSVLARIGDGFRLVPAALLGPPIAPSQSPTFTNSATNPTGKVLAGDTVVSVDGYFATAHEETSRFSLLCSEEKGGGEADSWMPDLWLSDRLFG